MTLRGALLRELEWVCKNSARLLSLVRSGDLSYAPREGMRSLREVCDALAQAPAVDMVIMRGLTEEEVGAEEGKLTQQADAVGLPGGWRDVLQAGQRDLSRFIETLSMTEFETGSGTAYYGRTQNYAQWLMECVTRIYHLRSQLFTYLQLLGYEVGSRNLYD